jgi:hypothetical protein
MTLTQKAKDNHIEHHKTRKNTLPQSMIFDHRNPLNSNLKMVNSLPMSLSTLFPMNQHS